MFASIPPRGTAEWSVRQLLHDQWRPTAGYAAAGAALVLYGVTQDDGTWAVLGGFLIVMQIGILSWLAWWGRPQPRDPAIELRTDELWAMTPLGPVLVPWAAIAAVDLVADRAGSAPALGVKVTDPATVTMTAEARSRQSVHRPDGWDLLLPTAGVGRDPQELLDDVRRTWREAGDQPEAAALD
ncbi:hypothetical protein DSM112329_04036 [Paraconexibacter sp. AEG42_29]|uniref:PH domain-containing protein n=1 Tax=Paraconexibacter sp. AEG42_29 TaxID=2997339 RepID=A0AAU7AZX1_9ACTN